MYPDRIQRPIEGMRIFARLRRRIRGWKRSAKNHRRLWRDTNKELGTAYEDLEDTRSERDELRGENQVLKMQVEMMLAWAARWQAKMDADAAVYATIKVRAPLDVARANEDL